ncbi:hypothetical protein ACIPL1_27465 [Pseudomonas sp. NPDC090202]|uniref:hypothetical protein n=1 Tax=Pseudomonas sp. NPDC090202 TaxID=3364476 RepID=UPI00381126F0
MEPLHGAPAPAPEMVELPRIVVETLLNELEARDPQHSQVGELRLATSAPAVELWAVFVPSVGEVWPAMSRDHAEHVAQATLARYQQVMAAERIDCPITIDVVRSPYTPAEHFEILAGQMVDEAANYHKAALEATAARDKLRAQLAQTVAE